MARLLDYISEDEWEAFRQREKQAEKAQREVEASQREASAWQRAMSAPPPEAPPPTYQPPPQTPAYSGGGGAWGPQPEELPEPEPTPWQRAMAAMQATPETGGYPEEPPSAGPAEPSTLQRVSQFIQQAAPIAAKAAIPFIGPSLAGADLGTARLAEPSMKAMEWLYEHATQPSAELAYGPGVRGEIETYPGQQPSDVISQSAMRSGLNIGRGLKEGQGLGDIWQQAGERWRQTPEAAPGAKGLLEFMSPADLALNVVPLPGARAAQAIGRGAKAAKEAIPSVGRVGRRLATEETGAIRPGGFTGGEAKSLENALWEAQSRGASKEEIESIRQQYLATESRMGLGAEDIAKGKPITGITDQAKFEAMIEKKYGGKIADRYSEQGYKYLVLDNGVTVETSATSYGVRRGKGGIQGSAGYKYDEIRTLKAKAEQPTPPPAQAVPEKQYDASLDAFRKASSKFRAIQKAYRAKEIDDAAFLAGKTEFDKAAAIADAAETRFIEAKNAPVAEAVPEGAAKQPWEMDSGEFKEAYNKAFAPDATDYDLQGNLMPEGRFKEAIPRLSREQIEAMKADPSRQAEITRQAVIDAHAKATPPASEAPLPAGEAVLPAGTAPMAADYVYHGTSGGRGRSIQKKGLLTGKEAGNTTEGAISFSNEQYAKSYADRKADALGGIVLRVKKSNAIIPDPKTGKGDFKTSVSIPPEDIEVKIGNEWVPIKDYDFIERKVTTPAPVSEVPLAASEPTIAAPTPSVIAQATNALKRRGVRGDALLDAQDLGKELSDKGGVLNPDGTVTLYHRTTPENARKIVATGRMVNREDGLFFGTLPTGQIEGYGDAVVKVNLPLEKLALNDVFSNEAHVWYQTGTIGQSIPVGKPELWQGLTGPMTSDLAAKARPLALPVEAPISKPTSIAPEPIKETGQIVTQGPSQTPAQGTQLYVPPSRVVPPESGKDLVRGGMAGRSAEEIEKRRKIYMGETPKLPPEQPPPIWEGKTGRTTYEEMIPTREPEPIGPPYIPSGRAPGGAGRMGPPGPPSDPYGATVEALRPDVPSIGDQLGEGGGSFMRAMYDRNWNLGQLEQTTGIPTHKTAQLVSGAVAAGEDRVRRLVLPITEKLGKDVKHLEEYMVLMRDSDILARNPHAKLPGGVETPSQVQKGLKQLAAKIGPQRFAAIEQAAKEFYAVNREWVLGVLEKEGMKTAENIRDITAAHPHYVDFHRGDYSLVDDLQRATTRPEANVSRVPIDKMQLEGSARKLDQPLVRSTAQIINTAVLVARNRAAKTIVAALMEQEKGLAETAKLTRQLTAKEAAEHSNVTDTISFFHKGEKAVFQVPPVFATIAKGLEGETASTVWRFIRASSAPLRAGAITYNPAFVIVNPIRDAISAFYREGLVPLSRDYVRGWVAAINKNTDFTEAAEANMLMSGIVDNFRSTEALSRAKALGRIEVKDWKDVLAFVPRWIERANLTAEQATRIGTYYKLKNQGVAELDRAVRSRDVSVDFAKAGNVMKMVNQVLPFTNAGVHGASNTLRLMKDNPKQALMASMALGVPTVLAWLNNQRFETSKQIPDYEYANNWIFQVGEGTKQVDPKYPNKAGDKFPIYFKIPKGPTGGFLTAPIEFALRAAWAKDDRSVVEHLGSAVGTMLKSISPIEPSVSAILPPALSTPLGAVSGYDPFRGQQIVPRSEEGRPAELQYGAETSEVAVALGERFKVSPRMIEWAIKDYTAGVGGQALWLSDLILGAVGYDPTVYGEAKKQPLSQVEELSRTPLVGRFLGTRGTAQSNVEWERLREAQTESQRQAAEIPELKRLGMTIGPVGDSISLREGLAVRLEPKERAELQQATAQTVTMQVEKLLEKPKYRDLSDGQKAKLLRTVIDRAREAARVSYLRGFERDELKRRVVESLPVAVGQ